MRRLTLAARFAAALCAMVVLAAPVAAQKGGNPNPQVVPINASAHGMSYGEWGGAWWSWALQYPESQCPILDPDGSRAGLGQSGPVYFLCGSFGSPVERTITIPPGKSLFFPLYNGMWWYPEDSLTEAGLRAGVKAQVDAVTELGVTLDGKALKDLWSYRAQTPPGGFLFNIPEGSISTTWGYTPGPRFPAVVDGYWIMLTPLTPGQHTLLIHSRTTDPSFQLDVLYHITVAPGGK